MRSSRRNLLQIVTRAAIGTLHGMAIGASLTRSTRAGTSRPPAPISCGWPTRGDVARLRVRSLCHRRIRQTHRGLARYPDPAHGPGARCVGADALRPTAGRGAGGTIQAVFGGSVGEFLRPGDRVPMSGGQTLWKMMIRRARKHVWSESWIDDVVSTVWRITPAGRRAAELEKPARQTAG